MTVLVLESSWELNKKFFENLLVPTVYKSSTNITGERKLASQQ